MGNRRALSSIPSRVGWKNKDALGCDNVTGNEDVEGIASIRDLNLHRIVLVMREIDKEFACSNLQWNEVGIS